MEAILSIARKEDVNIWGRGVVAYGTELKKLLNYIGYSRFCAFVGYVGILGIS
jgi:hypothetical protein